MGWCQRLDRLFPDDYGKLVFSMKTHHKINNEMVWRSYLWYFLFKRIGFGKFMGKYIVVFAFQYIWQDQKPIPKLLEFS